jgi:ribosomal protein S13
MFYSLLDDKAPVYGNENQNFMFDMAMEAKDERETWYWPESSYWVTFDTSVPLFLLPYLKSRYEDMMLMADQNIDGHVTFSSGWEWGYWLIDYSIAHWSWDYGNEMKSSAEESIALIHDLFETESSNFLWQEAMDYQEKQIKHNNLIAMLSAKPPFQELPWPFNKNFQPGQHFSMVKAAIPIIGKKDRAGITKQANELKKFYSHMHEITRTIKTDTQVTGDIRDKLRSEILRAMDITSLRALHRHYTMMAGAYRNTNMNDSSTYYHSQLIQKAKDIREQAQGIVWHQEQNYRYPLRLIARKAKTSTSYDFGYLYPVSKLYFWEREEQQAKHSRFDAFFMNIWDFWKTLGLEGLFNG